jgi:hypothetical protein
MEILVTAFVRDEGTLVIFAGLTEFNRPVTFAVEHRYAPDILAAVEAGEEPVVEVPHYLIIS